MATITIKGNTSKAKKFFPATEEKPAMLYFDTADKIVKRDKSKKDVWYNCIATRGYAETLYKYLHAENEVSRKVQVTGRIVDEPKVRVDKAGQAHSTITIWVDQVDFLDDNWPAHEPGETEGTEPVETEEPVQLDDGEFPF